MEEEVKGTTRSSHSHERSSNESFCLFAEAIEFAREEQDCCCLARPVPGYRRRRRHRRSLLPIPMPPLHRGIANFFLAAGEDALRGTAREIRERAHGAMSDRTKDLALVVGLAKIQSTSREASGRLHRRWWRKKESID